MLSTQPLRYRKSELEPVMSRRTIDYHYEHLAKNYAKNYNAGKGSQRFNKAGNFLHNIFFAQFKKPTPINEPTPIVSRFIQAHYDSLDEFKAALKSVAMKIEGSGWVYLSTDGKIKVIHNHNIRHDILLLVDWWEHAWALDFEWEKEKYIDGFWKIVDWSVINERI